MLELGANRNPNRRTSDVLTIQEYALLLRASDTSDLTTELGVRDNYPIFLSANVHEALDLLGCLKGITRDRTFGEGELARHWFTLTAGKVDVQLLPYLSAGFSDLSAFEKEYHTTIMIHPKAGDMEALKKAAELAAEICDLVVCKNISAYFYYSHGGKEQYADKKERKVSHKAIDTTDPKLRLPAVDSRT